MRETRFAVRMSPTGEVSVVLGVELRVEERMMRTAALSKPFEFEGGMIVLSTDVNATQGKGWANWAKGVMKTIGNRLLRNRKVDDELKRLVEERGA